MTAPQVWLITGIPGAGKSTVARALAASCSRGVHIEGDSMQRLIVSGGVPPSAESSQESERQIELSIRNQCMLAASFHESGFTVVIDYVVTSWDRLNAYRKLLPDARLRFVMLNPGTDVALRRDRERAKQVLGDWLHLEGEMRESLSGTGLWLDNGALSIAETVTRILDNAPEAALEHN